MAFRFKPTDFVDYNKMWTENSSAENVSEIANRLLDEYVKTLPELSGGKDPRDDSNNVGWTFGQFKSKDDTHRARLWNIEEIEPCEHTTVETIDISSPHWIRGTEEGDRPRFRCVSCGKWMKAVWETTE